MEITLNCYSSAIKADKEESGSLFFDCPWCEKRVHIPSSFLSYSETEVRTKVSVSCPIEECCMPYDLKHSSFVVNIPDDVIEWPRYAGKPKDIIYKLWRERNGKRKHNG